MLDMLVLVTGWMHELVWLSTVRFCTRDIAMEIYDSYFIKWYFQLNKELITILLDKIKWVITREVLILSVAR